MTVSRSFPSLGVSLSKTKAAAHLYCLGNAVYGIDKMAVLVENCGGSIMWQNVRVSLRSLPTAFHDFD